MKPDRSNPDIAAYLDWAADYPCLPSHRVTWMAAVEWARKDAASVTGEITARLLAEQLRFDYLYQNANEIITENPDDVRAWIDAKLNAPVQPITNP